MQYISHIISERRKELGVSLEMLTSGLCHFSFLTKIENNEMYADKFLMDFILQRLGIGDSFEHYLKLEDYIEQKTREDIIESYKHNDFNVMSLLLDKYKKIVDVSANIHRQFIAYVEMLLKDEFDILEFQRIIEITVLDFQKKALHQLVLSDFELFYIVEFAKQLIFIEKTDGEILFEDIYRYLNNEHLEYGIRRRFLPIVTSYVVDSYISKREYQTAYRICYETIEFMREMLELNFLPLLLEKIVFLMGKLDEVDEKFTTWKEMLIEFYSSKNIEPNNSFADVFHGRQYHIINDVIKRRRLMFGISQQKLAEDICDVKTISRLENGKTTMHTKKVNAIMKKLNLSGQLYDECAVTDDYEQFLLVKKAKVAMAHNDFSKTFENICALEEKIDLSIERNLQYINHEKVLIDQFSNGVKLTECLEKYRKCLEITGVRKASVMQLTNREANIIINMICCLYELGEYDEMEEWFGVLGNTLNDCWHLASHSLYLNVLFSMRANLGEFHKAFEILSKLVRYNLTTKRFTNIHFITYLEAKYYREQIEEERAMTDEEILRYKKLVSIAEVVCDITKDSHVLGLIKKHCSFP